MDVKHNRRIKERETLVDVAYLKYREKCRRLSKSDPMTRGVFGARYHDDPSLQSEFGFKRTTKASKPPLTLAAVRERLNGWDYTDREAREHIHYLLACLQHVQQLDEELDSLVRKAKQRG